MRLRYISHPSMKHYLAYYNGSFVSEADVALSPLDRGFLYGDGLFETLRSVKRSIISYRDHYERLAAGCARIRINLPLTLAEMRHAIADLLIKNSLENAAIRITVSRGPASQFGYGFSEASRPVVLILVRPSKVIPDDLYQKGVGAEFMTLHHASPLKSLSALPYVLAKQAALDRQCYEMILHDEAGIVLEGTSSNIFMVHDSEVLTPSLDLSILPGITRKRVLQLLEERLNHPVRETIIPREDLMKASEVFLTNTNVQVLPVTRAGQATIGSGRVGPVTLEIINTFRQTLPEILE